MALASPTHALVWFPLHAIPCPRYVRLVNSPLHSGGIGLSPFRAHF